MQPLLPMLAVAAEPFDSAEYLFEVKWDGVRALAAIEPCGWRLWGRRKADYTDRYPELAFLQHLPVGTVLDGELVQLVHGRADFEKLLSRHQLVSPGKIRRAAEQDPASYIVFDVLQIAGQSLLSRPLGERRQRLEALCAGASPTRLVFSRGVVGAGRTYFGEVIQQGHEGVMAKQLNSPYRPGQRTSEWRKIKPRQQTVCVIFGYRHARGRLDSLLLAAQGTDGLRYVGPVSCGLTEDLRQELEPQLAMRTCTQPLIQVPTSATWVLPELYCLVRGFGFLGSGRMRFPSVQRLLPAANGSPGTC
jgi:ATP-dependent DNA ligase